MKKIFLDCGAWNGHSVRVFRQVYDQNCEYFIHSFEPNPRYSKIFPKFEKHISHDEAVSIEDGVGDFYLDNTTKKKAGSSLIKEKTTGNLDIDNPIKVGCVDLDRWVKENFSNGDFIILKLDIEGKEYDVLERMIKRGSIEYINKIFIEWHWNKVGVSQSRHNKLVKQIKDMGIPVVERWKVGYKK